MKIVALTAENIKKLVAVEIRPDGNLVEITGKNGQGKTSVLDCIWWALAGTTHIQAAPIRKGADKARIRLDLGELIVTRTFSRKEDGGATTSIKVENTEGMRPTSPQTMLDGLLGALSFDPLAFARMDADKKFNALRRFVPDVDFDAIDKAQKADYEQRTVVNRQAKEAETMAAGIKVPDGTPAKKADESALVDELAAVGKHNADIELRKDRRATAAKEAEDLRAEAQADRDHAAELRQEIVDLEKAAADTDKKADALEKKLADAPALGEPKDPAEVRARLDDAKRVNTAVDLAAKRKEHADRAAALKAESETITARMDKRDTDKQAAIAAAKLPIEGITFGTDEILLDGVPFDQASDAEQLRASVAMAMASNPKLRVIRVRDGSLLDEDAMKIIAEMADTNDYQVWIERVDNSGKVGFVLEGGHVRHVEKKAAA